jgi:4'-phosphopantetheinyl transferase
LDRSPAEVRRLERMLAADEAKRAECYRFQQDRDHFIVARALLRAILASYVRSEPQQLRFHSGPYGKPALTQSGDGDPLRFNLSHSHGLAVFAVSRRELGIDLEYVRGDLVDDAMLAHVLSVREMAALGTLPPATRCQAFFASWTRKEAFVKATGRGLSLPLDQVEVSLSPEEAVVRLAAASDEGRSSRWSLRTLAAGPGYAAALCVEGDDGRLTCWQWPES